MLTVVFLWGVTIQLKLEEKDFLKAAKHHGRNWLIRTLILSLLLFLILWGWLKTQSPDLVASCLWSFAVFVLIIWYKWSFQYLGRARKNFRQQSKARHEATWTFGEEDLIIEQEKGFVKEAWGDFLKWRDCGDMILIYVTDFNYLIIPKHNLSEDEWMGMMKILGRKLGFSKG